MSAGQSPDTTQHFSLVGDAPTESTGNQSTGNAGHFSRSSSARATRSYSFSRTLQHYLDNAPNWPGLEINASAKTATFGENFQFIPYDNIRATLTPRDWKEIATYGRAIRIKSLGFRVHNMQTITQSISPHGGVPQVTNQFCSKPFAIFAKDTDMVTKDMLETSTDIETIARYACNDHMRVAWPDSYDDGLLKHVKWNLGPKFVEGMGITTSHTIREGYTSRGTINTLNGFFDIHFSDTGDWGHTWVNPNAHWYAIGDYLAPTNSDGTSRRHFGFDPKHFIHFGAVEANARTGINMNCVEPPPCYAKLLPLHQLTAPMLLSATCFITYTSEIEVLGHPNGAFMMLHEGIPQKIDYTQVDPWDLAGHTSTKWNVNRENYITQFQQGYSFEKPKAPVQSNTITRRSKSWLLDGFKLLPS